MAIEQDTDTSTRPKPKRVVRKRTIAALIVCVVLSFAVHFTILPAVTAMTPRWDYSLLPKQAVAIITLSRREQPEATPKPTPTPTEPPLPLPRTHRDLALLKYKELGSAVDRRSVLRPPARRVSTLVVNRNVAAHANDSSPDANVAVANPVPTPVATEPPGTSRTATGGSADLSVATVWGDDNPARPIKRVALAIADTASGVARVEVDIDPDGTVSAVRLVQSSGDPSVDQAALDAARASTYAPATLNGLPIHGSCVLEFAPPSASTT